MKSTHVILAILLVGIVVFGVNTIGLTQTSRQTNGIQQTPAFEYATLMTQTSADPNNPNFVLLWNENVNDIIGRSNRSLADARRKMNSQLGGANSSRTNLSVLLTTIGRNGWRLVETTQTEQTTNRIFIRAAQSR